MSGSFGAHARVLALACALLASCQNRAAETRLPAAPLPVPAPESRRDPRAEYVKLAAELEAELFERVLPFWYPKIIDPRGGFRQRIKSDGTLDDDGHRSLVFQARSTWVAAEVAQRYPELRDRYLGYAQHGLEFLERSMWDREAGGLFWEIDASGQPTTTEKHAYGLAFAIYAAAATARAIPQAREFASTTFEWLDAHAHDGDHGGYREALERDGRPIESPSSGHDSDLIGTRYGRKSMNSHLHLLEALAELYRVAPSDRVRLRLEETLALVRDRITDPAGFFQLYFSPDWTPIPTVDSYGHDVEGAFLLLEAARVLGMPADAKTRSVAERLLEHALAHGWDRVHGGFFAEGVPGGKVTDPRKIWWVQAEGLNGLLTLHELRGRATDRYFRAFLAQWEFIGAHVSDRRLGEWRESVGPAGERPDPQQPKGHAWKASYHDGRALLFGAERLRRLASRPE